MIRKPPSDWQTGESAAVRTAKMAVGAAQGGVRVARTGGHLARGLLCWGFAVLWGFAAFAGGVLSGNLPTLIGVGAMAALMAWAGNRAFARARTASDPDRSLATTSPARHLPTGGNVICYGSAQLLRSAVVWAVLALAALWLFWRVDGVTAVLVTIATPAFFALAILSLAKMFGDRLALHWDDSALTVATLWRRRTIPWSQVNDVGVTTITSYALYGLVRTGRVDMLVIRTKGKLIGDAKVSLRASLLDLEGRTLAGLVAELGALRFGGSPGAARSAEGIAPSQPPLASRAKQEAEFDPDAIIARYIAQKAQAEKRQAATDASLRGEACAVPPPRPFGRRTA